MSSPTASLSWKKCTHSQIQVPLYRDGLLRGRGYVPQDSETEIVGDSVCGATDSGMAGADGPGNELCP